MEIFIDEETPHMKEDLDYEETHLNPGDFVQCEIDDSSSTVADIGKTELEEGIGEKCIKIELGEGIGERCIKTELEDITEDLMQNIDCDVFQEQFYQPRRFVFQQGNIWFEELEEGKVHCGTCGESFARIVSHLVSNPTCAINLDLEEFKDIWSKFRNEQRRKKYEEKRKSENPEQFLKDQAERRKKYEEKKKAENPEQFLKNQAERRKKYEEKKRAENPLQFMKDRAERRKRYEERKKAEDPEKFLKDRAERQRKYAEKKKAKKIKDTSVFIV